LDDEHTDILAFVIVLLVSSLGVFVLYRFRWPTLSSTLYIDDQDAPTGRSEAGQPQYQIEPWPSCETGPEVLKPAADDLLQWGPVSKSANSSRAPDDDPTLIDRTSLR
jgi:hypothetical protein